MLGNRVWISPSLSGRCHLTTIIRIEGVEQFEVGFPMSILNDGQCRFSRAKASAIVMAVDQGNRK